jgi:hypothetical protein
MQTSFGQRAKTSWKTGTEMPGKLCNLQEVGSELRAPGSRFHVSHPATFTEHSVLHTANTLPPQSNSHPISARRSTLVQNDHWTSSTAFSHLCWCSLGRESLWRVSAKGYPKCFVQINQSSIHPRETGDTSPALSSTLLFQQSNVTCQSHSLERWGLGWV